MPARCGWPRYAGWRPPPSPQCSPVPDCRDWPRSTGSRRAAARPAAQRPALRARAAQRSAARRRQETGPGARRRRLADPRPPQEVPGRGNGFDYVHVAIDDHSWLAYAEVLADERSAPCAGFMTPCGGLVRQPRGHHRPGADRQRQELPRRAGLDRRLRPAGIARRFLQPGLGPTARPSGSTAPCRPSGPTPPHRSATASEPPPWTPGSSTTTLPAATPPPEVTHRSVDWPPEQPFRSRHLAHDGLGALARGITERPRRAHAGPICRH
jgi:hypothetical protein